MVTAGIALKLLTFEAGDLRIGLGNRGILRQIPVNDQFGTVRRRKELLLHELHAEESETEGGDRHPDGDPAMMHADQEDTLKDPRNSPLFFVMPLHPGWQN